MREIAIGDVRITSLIERDGPWREPEVMFPNYDPEVGRRHLAELPPFVFDPGSGKMVITYRTFVVRTPRHTVLVDTCTGEDKGYAAPFDFPKQRWLDEFRANGLSYESIDYVFCTHLHIDHCGWNTRLVNGRWVPTFPNAKYIFHKREYAAWDEAIARGETHAGSSREVFSMNCLPVAEAGQALLVDDDFELDDAFSLTPTPGHSPCHCCVEIRSRGQRGAITGDMAHHVLQLREPSWSTMFDWDPLQAEQSRRRFLGKIADTDTLMLPIHFSGPAAGYVEGDGERFRYRFRE